MPDYFQWGSQRKERPKKEAKKEKLKKSLLQVLT